MHLFLEEIYKYIKVFYFSIFIANEIFKSFFAKGDLIRYYYFISTYSFNWNRSRLVKCCFPISILPNFIVVLSIFIYSFNFFCFSFLIYNFPFFVNKNRISRNFRASNYTGYLWCCFSWINILQWFYSFTFAHSINNTTIISIFYF